MSTSTTSFCSALLSYPFFCFIKLYYRSPYSSKLSSNCRYNEELEGVVLAYKDERIVSRTAIVHPYFPLVRLLVSATLTVFKPKSGARIIGTVNKIANGYIGLVVLGFMNAVLRREWVRMEFQPELFEGQWKSTKNPKHTIAVGDVVAFTIKEVLQDGGQFASLLGELLEKNTGNVDVVGVVDESIEKRKKKKRDTHDKEGGKNGEIDNEHGENGIEKNKKRRTSIDDGPRVAEENIEKKGEKGKKGGKKDKDKEGKKGSKKDKKSKKKEKS